MQVSQLIHVDIILYIRLMLSINALHAGYLFLHNFVVCWFFKIIFFKKIKGLDLDQARRFVGPDLGANFFKNL